MKKIGKILKWIPPAFFALLILAGGASAIFFLLATILTLPIPKLQQFKKEKLKIGTGLTVLLSVILLVVGIMVSPTPPQDNDDEPSRSSMPATLLRNTCIQFTGNKTIRLYGENVFTTKDKEILHDIAEYLGVSFTALIIRMKQMKMFEKHQINEYITTEMHLNGGKAGG